MKLQKLKIWVWYDMKPNTEKKSKENVEECAAIQTGIKRTIRYLNVPQELEFSSGSPLIHVPILRNGFRSLIVLIEVSLAA